MVVELHNWFCSGCEKFVEASARNYETARRKHRYSVHGHIQPKYLDKREKQE